MKIEIKLYEMEVLPTLLKILIRTNSALFQDHMHVSLDRIEDLELNLTGIIKQLQDYRIKHNHE